MALRELTQVPKLWGFRLLDSRKKVLPGIAVNVAFAELQLACTDRGDDLLLRQTIFLPSRLVAESCSFS